jgi:pilus assembly protein Flp/PilA
MGAISDQPNEGTPRMLREYIDHLVETWLSFRESEEGQGLVEYALIIALVAILLVGALTLLQGQLTSVFSNISSNL